MLTFAEEVMLLILDDETGKLANAGSPNVDFALAGAVLMDLALRSKIDTDLDKLVVIDSTPTGEEILDSYLAQIAVEDHVYNARYWVHILAEHGPAIRDKALSMLVRKSILKPVEKKILWVFETRRYPVIDGTEQREVKRRIINLLLSDEIPAPRDIVLICLADTCELFPTILNAREAERLAPRIAQIRRLDLIGQAVFQVVERLRSDISNAMLLMPY
jgi:Golgi phosphoprotein 3